MFSRYDMLLLNYSLLILFTANMLVDLVPWIPECLFKIIGGSGKIVQLKRGYVGM